MRDIVVDDLTDLARGAAVLGSGGGGDPYVGRLLAQQAITQHGPVRLVDVDTVPDDAVVLPIGCMGAPTVMLEKLPSGIELAAAFRALERVLGRQATHVISFEAGGINSMTPIAAAAELGLPLIDADGMGRAFPELQMILPTLAGIAASPIALADERGNTLTMDTIENRWTERLARTATVEMGCAAALSTYSLTGRQVKDSMVHGTLSLCQAVGARIRGAREAHQDPVAAAADALAGRVVFRGKVLDLQRDTQAGFNRGTVILVGLGADDGRRMQVDFQNEYLVATENATVTVSVPDLVCLLDTETGEPVTAELVKYGLRVSVVGVPCDERWRSPAGLALVGPQAFGYTNDFLPLDRAGVTMVR